MIFRYRFYRSQDLLSQNLQISKISDHRFHRIYRSQRSQKLSKSVKNCRNPRIPPRKKKKTLLRNRLFREFAPPQNGVIQLINDTFVILNQPLCKNDLFLAEETGNLHENAPERLFQAKNRDFWKSPKSHFWALFWVRGLFGFFRHLSIKISRF